jgi:hypothetical protein
MMAAVTAMPALPADAGEAQGLLAEGTRWQTPYYLIDSGKDGPTVMIVGGVHGNEQAGAKAAEIIRHWPIIRGKLLVVPRASVPALLADKRCDSNEPAETRDLNRNFPFKGGSDTPHGAPAQAIWRLAAQTRPDWLVDLHEGIDFRKTSNSTGGSIIRTNSEEVVRITKIMLDAVNATIDNPKQKHVLLMPPIKGSLTRAAWERLQAKAMILETCRKDPLDVRIWQHRLMVHLLLTELKMIDEEKGLPQSRGGTEARRSKRSLEGDYTIWVIIQSRFFSSLSLFLCASAVILFRSTSPPA